MPPPSYLGGDGYYVFTVFRCRDVPWQRPHFLLTRIHIQRILMKFRAAITTTNRWIDYILGELYQGQRSRIQKIRIEAKPVLPRSERLSKFHSTRHAASAGLASPLRTCSGGGIIWPRAVFSSVLVTSKMNDLGWFAVSKGSQCFIVATKRAF